MLNVKYIQKLDSTDFLLNLFYDPSFKYLILLTRKFISNDLKNNKI